MFLSIYSSVVNIKSLYPPEFDEKFTKTYGTSNTPQQSSKVFLLGEELDSTICHVSFQPLNPKFPADLVTFTEETLNGKLDFLCSPNTTSGNDA